MFLQSSSEIFWGAKIMQIQERLDEEKDEEKEGK